MLKEIFIENYKSLKNSRVEFKDGLNIIIGKNGSGKSNLLEFIQRYANLQPFMLFRNLNFTLPSYGYQYIFDDTEGLKNYTFENKEKRSAKKESRITVSKGPGISNPLTTKSFVFPEQYTYDNLSEIIKFLHPLRTLNIKLFEYSLPDNLLWLDRAHSLNISPSPILPNYYYDVEQIIDSFSFTSYIADFFKDDLEDVRNNSPFEIDSEKIKSILEDSFIRTIKEYSIDNNLQKFSPIEEIRISPNINIYKIDDKILIENLTLEFKVNSVWVPWSYLSDGTKRLFYIIAEMSSQKDGLILIEEPELGIHPHQLYKLMQFIKEQSEEKQIIVSTHSPLILDTLDPDELDRITIAKIENGSSQFHRLTNEQVEKAKIYMHEQMDLSFYWLHSDLENG